MLVLDDLLLDGLKIYQDDELYKFTSDSVLLSKFASAKRGDVVADFCSGSGIVGLHYYALHKNVKSVDLFEIQKPLCDLSKKSVEYNGLNDIFTAYNTPLQEIGNEFNCKYSLILCNPPYRKLGTGETCESESIAICKYESKITIEEICLIASKKLKFGGRLAICFRADRLVDLLYSMRSAKLEPKRLQFVSKKEGETPYLVLVEAVLGGKSELTILKTLIN